MFGYDLTDIFGRRFRNLFGPLFVLPVFVGVAIFRIWPMIRAFHISLQEYSLLGGPQAFVGMGNYIELVQDPAFLNSLAITAEYTVMRVVIESVLAMGLAILLRKGGILNRLVRSISFIPVVTSLVVMAVMWKLMYHPMYGIINSFLIKVGLPPQEFLGSVSQALPSIAASVIWKHVGFSMIILLAGLNGIPRQYYESASVDGANSIQQFWHVTIPLIKRTLKYVVVINTIFSFRILGPVYVMTQGGPRDATNILPYFIYETAFQNFRMGYASSISVILFLVLGFITILQARLLRSDVRY